jgi:hypothetical protein
MDSQGILPETSNFYCLPGRAGGSPNVLGGTGARPASSGGTILVAFQGGQKSLSGRGLSWRDMICPFKAGGSGRCCIDTAIGHPLAGNCARWPIAGLPLHIKSEPTIGLPGTLREADATAVLIPDRAAQVDGLVSQCHLADVPGQPGALTAAGRMCRDIVRHPWHKPCSPLSDARGKWHANHCRCCEEHACCLDPAHYKPPLILPLSQAFTVTDLRQPFSDTGVRYGFGKDP